MDNDFLAANSRLWTEALLAVALPLAITVVAFAVLGIGILRSGRQSKESDLMLWLAAATVLLIVHLASQKQSQESEFLTTCGVGMLGALTILGMMLSLRRLRADKPRQLMMETTALVPILAILFALLIPATGQHVRSGRRTACKNNLKQIGLALHNFHDTRDAFPSRTVGDPPQSWRVSILPFLDQAPLYDAYHHDRAWDSDENAQFARTEILALQCPDQQRRRDDADRWLTSYAVPFGLHGIWKAEGSPTIAEIADGTSNTLAVVEACGRHIVWNEPRDVDLASTPFKVNLRGTRPFESPSLGSSYHRGGVHSLLADGSVRFLSSNIDPVVLQALTTADGGETVGNW